MGKWNTPSDYDYFDVPEAAGTPCATPGCLHNVSLPEWDTYCLACRQQQQDRADTDERRLAAQEARKRA